MESAIGFQDIWPLVLVAILVVAGLLVFARRHTKTAVSQKRIRQTGREARRAMDNRTRQYLNGLNKAFEEARRKQS